MSTNNSAALDPTDVRACMEVMQLRQAAAPSRAHRYREGCAQTEHQIESKTRDIGSRPFIKACTVPGRER